MKKNNYINKKYKYNRIKNRKYFNFNNNYNKHNNKIINIKHKLNN